MAAIKWIGGNGAGATDWNINANWSAGAKPTSADDVTFDNTSDGYACSLSIAAVCKSLTFTTGYTKAFSTNSQTLTISGNCDLNSGGTITINSAVTFNAIASLNPRGVTFADINLTTGLVTLAGALTCNTITGSSSGKINQAGFAIISASSLTFDGTGTLTLDGTTTITGDGNFHIGTGITWGSVLGSLILQGTGNFDVAVSQARFLTLTVSNTNKTTTVTNVGSYQGCNDQFTIGAGTLIINATQFLTCYTYPGTTPLIIDPAATIQGSGVWQLWKNTNTNTTWNLPAITMGGTCGLNIYQQGGSGNFIINMGGEIHINGTLTISSSLANITQTFNSNNYNITCGIITFGSSIVTGTAVYNYGSSVVTLNTSGSISSAAYTTGSTNVNWQTSTWYCAGAWTFGTNATYDINPTFTFTGVGTTTSNGKSFNNVIVTSGLRTFADAVIMNSFACSGTGGISCSSTCTVDKYILHDGTGNMVFSGALTITTGIAGQDVFRNTASAGTCTMTACDFTLSGNGFINLGKAVTMRNMTIAASGKTVINNSTATITITGATTNGTFTKGTGYLESNGQINITHTENPNLLVIGSGTFNGTGGLTITCQAATGTSFNIPAITYTGSGRFSISAGTSMTANITATLTGALNWGTAPMTLSNGWTGGLLTYDTSASNYSLTCGALSLGNNNSSATKGTAYNFRASTITVGSLIAAYTTGLCVFTMGSSSWTCSGDWSWGSTWAVTLNTFSLTITNTATITPSGKNFYSLTLDSPGNTITWATGSTTIHDLRMEPGTIIAFFAGATYTITTNVANQWDGSAGNLVRIKSTTWGTSFTLTMSGGAHTVLYVAVSDCSSSATVTATGGTNVNSGNNTNWSFSSKFWIGGAAGATTDWENSNNWSASSGGSGGAGKPTTGEGAIFDSGSVNYACSLTASVVCGSLLVTTAWNKAFNMAGYNITSTGFITIDGTTGSSWTHNGLITITSGGSYTVNTGIASMSLTNADIDLKQDGAISIVKTTDATSSNLQIRNITFCYSGYYNYITGAALYFKGVLVAGGGGLTTTYGLVWCGIGTITPYTWNGTFITGNASNGINYKPQGASTIAVDVTSGTIYLTFYDYTGVLVTYNQIGNIVTATFTFSSVAGSNGTTIYNTNNYTIDLATGTSNLSITQTSGPNTSTTTLNFGSSLIYIRGNSFSVLTSVGARCNLNLGSSIWSIRISWTNTAQTVVNPGTSIVNFDMYGSASNPIITSAGQSFYAVNINIASAATFTLADNFLCNTLTHATGAHGNVTAAGFSITAASSINFDSTGTLNLAAVLITGNGDFHIGTAVGATTLTNCTIEMRGTGSFDIDKSGLTFVSVKFNAPTKKISVTGAANFTTGRLYIEPGTEMSVAAGLAITITTYVAGDWDGTLGNLVTISSLTPGVPFILNNPASV